MLQFKAYMLIFAVIGALVLVVWQREVVFSFISNVGSPNAVVAGSGCVPPIEGGTVTSGGYYNAYRSRNYKQKHWGVDIESDFGTPIHAVKAGTIKKAHAVDDNNGWGKYITLIHDDTTTSVYAHLSKLTVTSGHVSMGQQIGEMGFTGNADEDRIHLHIEIGLAGDTPGEGNRKYTDPQAWLKACGGWRPQWNY